MAEKYICENEYNSVGHRQKFINPLRRIDHHTRTLIDSCCVTTSIDFKSKSSTHAAVCSELYHDQLGKYEVFAL